MNEDWYMVGIVVDVLCELMLSSYLVDHVNISWSTSWELAQLPPGPSCSTNGFVSIFGLDLGHMSCSRVLIGVSEELPVVNNSYTSINDDGKNINN